MKLTKETTTDSVNNFFNSAFPFLELRFYTTPHEQFQGSKKMDEISANKTLDLINPNLKPGSISFNGQMTVKDLESSFENDFGLHVQVFRRAGDLWLQTSKTDYWTLDEQNESGEKSAK